MFKDQHSSSSTLWINGQIIQRFKYSEQFKDFYERESEEDEYSDESEGDENEPKQDYDVNHSHQHPLPKPNR